MASSLRNSRSPPSPTTPSHMRTNSILIQTDDGRRFDSSIQYNRIIDDPFYRKTRSPLKPILSGLIILAVSACLLISENLGFSSFPLAVTDKKYLGRKPNTGSNSIDGESPNLRSGDFANVSSLGDDDDDELRGMGDDDTQYIVSDVSFEENDAPDNMTNASRSELGEATNDRGVYDVDADDFFEDTKNIKVDELTIEKENMDVYVNVSLPSDENAEIVPFDYEAHDPSNHVDNDFPNEGEIEDGTLSWNKVDTESSGHQNSVIIDMYLEQLEGEGGNDVRTSEEASTDSLIEHGNSSSFTNTSFESKAIGFGFDDDDADDERRV